MNISKKTDTVTASSRPICPHRSYVVDRRFI